ncbi:MAG: hypothetical protein JXA22_10030, partial [Candidatus Thermoplasmatota archaeon]|nr:hypothetical protein [Candidatus Thermoplasmatota archaeon]
MKDLNPSSSSIFLDSTFLNSLNKWTGNFCFKPGTYNITLWVLDNEGNNATDQVLITVIDTTDPVA